MRRNLALAVVASFLLVGSVSAATTYTAFSFKVARGQVEKDDGGGALRESGITRAVALIYDHASDDIIIVGKRVEGQAPLSQDDWVVAVRAILKEKKDPAVSIDRTDDTETTERQDIRFEGGLEDTQFGRDLLDADIVLKRLGLGTHSAEVFGLHSYLDLSVDDYESSGKQSKLVSRFWFHPRKSASYIIARDGVVAVEQYKIGITNEVRGSIDNISIDRVAEQFASSLENNFQDIKLYFPELGRMEQLYYISALAQGLEASGMSKSSLVPYWLNDYRVNQVSTPRDYPVEYNSLELNKVTIELSGGVSLDALVVDLQDGVASSIKKYVLSARPSRSSLSWDVPLLALVWDTIYDPAKIDRLKTAEGSRLKPGMSLMKSVIPKDSPRSTPASTPSLSLSQGPLGMSASLGDSSNLLDTSWQNKPMMAAADAGNIGGVMLSGVASLSGGGTTNVNLSGGDFSFIVDGQNAKLAPEAFRKFVTALWTVYYSNQDPGISIDPIAPGVDKHLVRYIGNVINSDLGRVMREADYLMKKWAVGTERPSIAGFKNPDDISGKRGSLSLAASRFWFVPEGMKFRRSGDMLLFDQGRMTVRTEYLSDAARQRADPSNEEFARWFTRDYEQVAERYPVYRELFDYAKLVALAKYLKEKGVPLYWFLMANKSLVLTEDSPGTVDELAKGSEYFKNIRISGGVELTTEGEFVFDEEAVKALRTAWSRNTSSTRSGSSMGGPGEVLEDLPTQAVSFDVGEVSYTILPRHSLTSGRDQLGNRYQTDIAFRSGTEPGLEVVRYFDPLRPDGGEFGNGWRLLVPYRVSPADDERRDFLNASIPVRMKIRHLLTGEEEVLTFSTDRYSIAAWVPDELSESHLVGLFIMSDASFRLADKIGNEFRFDPGGYLTNQLLGDGYHLTYDYLSPTLTTAFAGDPYEVRPTDDETEPFLNVILSSRMTLYDLQYGAEEVLHFQGSARIAGYYPDNPESRFQVLAILSDTSYRLLDMHGNEIAFHDDGSFAGFSVTDDERMIRSISLGKEQRLDFRYCTDPTGRIAVASAHLFEGKNPYPRYAVSYRYNESGRLVGVKQTDTRVAQGDQLSSSALAASGHSTAAEP